MKKILLILTGLLFAVATPVLAATFGGGDIYEHKSGSIFDDIYIAGGTIDVSGDVVGDGLVVGGEVSVLGNVSQDIIAAGGTVNVIGVIGDDARVAGGNVSISSRIGDDLVVAGGLVKILSDASVAGDAVVAAGAAIISGTVSGDLTVYAEEISLNGPVNGDVTLHFTKNIELGEDVAIAGNLIYSASEELVIPEGVIIGGEVSRVESPASKFEKHDFSGAEDAISFGFTVILLITGLLAVLLLKKFSTKVGELTYNSFAKNAVIGFVALIVVPITTIILFITVAGFYIGIILLLLYILLLMITKVYAGIVFGGLLAKLIKKEVIINWMWAAIGIVLLHLIVQIPVIGMLVGFVVGMATFGTLLSLMYKSLKSGR